MRKVSFDARIDLGKWVSGNPGVMEASSTDVAVCTESEPLGGVALRLAESYRRLPVTGRGNRLRGVITSSDVLRLFCRLGDKEKLLAMKVSAAMTRLVVTIDRKAPLREALDFFRRHRHGGYPVTHMKKVCGIITEHDVVKLIRGNTGLKVRELMVKKPIVTPDGYTVSDVVKMLCMGGFRRLTVVRDSGLAGMFTVSDALRLVISDESAKHERMKVREVMKRGGLIFTGPDEDVHAAVKLITERGRGGLPVVKDNELLGIITEGDIAEVCVLP